MTDKLKIELGGGTNPRDGFLNVDCRKDLGRVDHVVDLEWMNVRIPGTIPLGGQPDRHVGHLPFASDSVGEVYSAHCLEHVANLNGVLHELGRVCCHGAKIEIHVPHYLHPDAMCPSHKHTIGENSVKGWTKQKWGGKWLDLVSVVNLPSLAFSEAKELHPGWKDDQIMRFVPGTCIEVQFVLRVRQG